MATAAARANALQTAIPGQILGSTAKYTAGPGTHVFGGDVCSSTIGAVVEIPGAAAAAGGGGASSPAAAIVSGASGAGRTLTFTPGGAGAAGAETRPSPSTRGKPTSQYQQQNQTQNKNRASTISVQRYGLLTDQTNNGQEQATGNGGASFKANGTASNILLPAVDSIVLARVTRINPRQANVAILVVGEGVCRDEFPGVIRVQDVRATEKDKVKIFHSFRPGDIVRAQVISLGDQSNYYLSTASNHFGVVMATSEVGNQMYPISWKEFKDPVTGATEARKVAKPF